MKFTDEDSMEDPGNKDQLSWNEKIDDLLIEWCDVARCYKWLHMRAFESYSIFNMLYTIPSIVLSTVTGTASFATESMPIGIKLYAPMAIGTINIFIGILTTLQRYFKIAELNESYKVAYISWDKFARNIQIEISKDPKYRSNAKSFFKITRTEYDRLIEMSPPVPTFILRKFSQMRKNKKVSGLLTRMMKKLGIIKIEENVEQEEDDDFLVKQLHIPDIFDKVESSYLYSWYKKEKRKNGTSLRGSITSTNFSTADKKISEMLADNLKIIKKQNFKRIDAFIQEFKKVNERDPMQYEIEDHFKDTDVEKNVNEYLITHGMMNENSADIV